MYPVPPSETIQLERFRFALQHAVSASEFENLRDNLRLDIERDMHMRCLLVRLEKEILGERLGTHAVRYPADWWQAAKERWFPIWAIRRWPVWYTQHVYEARALYPRVAMPGEYHRYHVVHQVQRVKGGAA